MAAEKEKEKEVDETYDGVKKEDLDTVKKAVNLVNAAYVKLKGDGWHVTGVHKYELKEDEGTFKLVLCNGDQCTMVDNVKVNVKSQQVEFPVAKKKAMFG